MILTSKCSQIQFPQATDGLKYIVARHCYLLILFLLFLVHLLLATETGCWARETFGLTWYNCF